MSLVALSINPLHLKPHLWEVTNYLETGTLKTRILGKTAKNICFSGKGWKALSHKPFQIYYRINLCGYETLFYSHSCACSWCSWKGACKPCVLSFPEKAQKFKDKLSSKHHAQFIFADIFSRVIMVLMMAVIIESSTSPLDILNKVSDFDKTTT